MSAPIEIIGAHAIARLNIHGFVIVRQTDLNNMLDIVKRVTDDIVKRATDELGKHLLASAHDTQPIDPAGRDVTS